MRKLLFFLLLACSTLTVSAAAPRYTVVIDAGHGGTDPGAPKSKKVKVKEKTVALDVAKQIGDLITSRYDDVDVVYTRRNDVFVELKTRVSIAKNAKANFFISIHCNASDNYSAHGTEVFYFSTTDRDRTKRREEAIDMENEAILYESKENQAYYRKTQNILAGIRAAEDITKSERLATLVLDEICGTLGTTSRGIKPTDRLYVLNGTNMPAILVELAFISNDHEYKLLTGERTQHQFSQAVADAFFTYYDAILADRAANAALLQKTPTTNNSSTPQPAAASEKQPAANEKQPAATSAQTSADEGATAPKENSATPKENQTAASGASQTAENGAGATRATTHTIKKGETLYRISTQYGVTLADIVNANPGLDPDRIQAGQTLVIPAK